MFLTVLAGDMVRVSVAGYRTVQAPARAFDAHNECIFCILLDGISRALLFELCSSMMSFSCAQII
jgi:hypothetical protein